MLLLVKHGKKVLKKFTFFLILIFVAVSLFFAQTVIENPKKPLISDSVRTLKIQELLRIKDIGENFFFQYPRFIKVAEDRTILVYDQDELLRFDQTGKHFSRPSADHPQRQSE